MRGDLCIWIAVACASAASVLLAFAAQVQHHQAPAADRRVAGRSSGRTRRRSLGESRPARRGGKIDPTFAAAEPLRPPRTCTWCGGRGLLMGNRGGRLHGPDPRSAAPAGGRAGICCLTDYRGSAAGDGDGYTEIFFLDEATALAAGHRPCFFCRRADARAFAAAWARATAAAAARARRWTWCCTPSGSARRAPPRSPPARGHDLRRRRRLHLRTAAARPAGASRATAGRGLRARRDGRRRHARQHPRGARGRLSAAAAPERGALAQRAVGRRVPAAGEAVAVGSMP